MSVSFNSSTTFPIGLTPASEVVADFNSDGNLDVVTGGRGGLFSGFSGGLSTILGTGTGKFGSPILSSGQQFGSATSLASGDFDGDGNLDVITTGRIFGVTASDLFVALGDGKGNFKSSTNLLLGSTPSSVAVGDLDGDRQLDAVTANSGSNTVSVLLGDGKGGFKSTSNVTVEGNPKSVALRDFNGDGRLDILSVTTSGSYSETTGKLSLLLGDGKGGFTSTTATDLGLVGSGSSSSLTVADFNGDGRLDAAAAAGGSLTVLLGNSTFNSQQPFQAVFKTDLSANALSASDFNGDGRLDLAAANTQYGATNGTVILLGNGSGGFSLPVALPPADTGIIAVATGDFNKDNKPDLTAVGSSALEVALLLNTTSQTDAIVQGTRTVDFSSSVGFIDASSEQSGSATIDLTKGTFVLNSPTKITRSLSGVDDVIPIP